MEIRELKKGDDLKALVQLSRDFFYEYESYHPYFFKIDKIEDNDIISYFARFIGTDDRKAFVAVESDAIIGYISVYIKEQADFWKIKNVGDISGLMVQKEHRGKGIGKKLLQRAVGYFKGKGIKQYALFTSVNNKNGIEFYEKCGLEKLYTTMIGEVE
ncbi:MAG: GNAT family N-acetyltransferase [Candidatus Edwardsbacteria bacterium]|nr:GNAT family N-acetyltransferase [Candidatus Edwardsbacteria bacterium]